MKRARVALIAAAVLAVATVAFAQKPDFSGTWTLDPEASGAPPAGTGGGGGGGGQRGGGGPMTVKQTADTLTIERQGQGGAMTTTYKLDGSESDITMGQMTAKASAKWDGNKLVITTKSERGEQTQTWSLAGGVLTIEGTGGRGPTKRVYKKST
jgi:hypothetical protein